MAVAPCKDCPDRQMGCHGQCEKYQTYRALQTEENEHNHMIKSCMKTDKRWFEREARKKARWKR